MGLATLVLLPGVLLGLCAGDVVFPRRGVSLQNDLEGMAVGGRRHPLALELLDEAEDLASLGTGLLGDLPVPEPECRELLAAFANSSVKMISCLVRSARPVKVCQNCYRQYHEVEEQLENISRVVGNSSECNSCAKSLLMSDRLQVVVLLSKFFTSTWKKANCASMYSVGIPSCLIYHCAYLSDHC
ncbi:hypothetical protein lerEdw1_021067 [Lerista edwardsae]|nr:hypothetical protein lerEdw1_021068 [Lerista edwardsae]KAJ6651336.1 hypothetical protein lerEdw1_021067 [Lerista edwardsae]